MFAFKESRKPLPAQQMADIWELTKDHGILIGKGGRYGNVSYILSQNALKSVSLRTPLEIDPCPIKNMAWLC